MHKEKIKTIFDQQAATYDQKWSRLAPINAALHLLTGAVLAELPAAARILCVGAGTGTEIVYFAGRFPEWRFVVVEPSAAMLEVCRRRAEEQGILSRCVFHSGYLDSLPAAEPCDAATAFLVSQFILERVERSRFFQGIAERLCPEGRLVCSDLAGDLTGGAEGSVLLKVWFQVMQDGGALPNPEEIERMRQAYTRDVAVLPPGEVCDIIKRGGFDLPVQIFQAGMIHAWSARRSRGPAGTADRG